MPSIAGHMVVAKLVSEKLNIDDPDFTKGNLLPDIILKSNSHHKKKGTYYYVPNLEYFRNKLDLTNKLHLGYFVHLLLDYYFLEYYVLKNISDLNVFANKMIYNEYDKINYSLVKRFDLDVEYLKKILKNFPVEINQEKLEYNLQCLSLRKMEATKYLMFESFADFLDKISEVISKEVEEYANKSNRMLICTK